MLKFLKNSFNLLKFLINSDFICSKDEIIINYKESIIHLDNLGNLSIRPKGLLLNHCTYQEVLETITKEEINNINERCC